MFSFVERKSSKLALLAALVIVASAAPTFASEADLILPTLEGSVSYRLAIDFGESAMQAIWPATRR